jgi:hypothetical protein
MMWNLWPQEKTNCCQMSKKKGICLEEEEVFEEIGCRMFDKKVRFYKITLNYGCFITKHGMANIQHSNFGVRSTRVVK